MGVPYSSAKPIRWVRGNGGKLKIISGKAHGRCGAVEVNLYQRTIYPICGLFV